ncbi:hypothetical protein DRW42_00080 [Pedobacter miscanthi]|uniref:Uncharacterized protein n=1 Tax=Pedobacter miscanthi TaxID=2259170 RepID=A0A366LCV1_9SPHI|nr:hypothetical protein DRW42_00080 [Pedobacter miscanthi]
MLYFIKYRRHKKVEDFNPCTTDALNVEDKLAPKLKILHGESLLYSKDEPKEHLSILKMEF